MFKGDDTADGPTIQDWFDEFDALATVYQWSPQEKLVALVSKLKGAALSVYRTASNKEKRSFSKLREERADKSVLTSQAASGPKQLVSKTSPETR